MRCSFSIYTPENYYAGRYETKNTVRVLELAREHIEKNHDVIELALNASDIERITRGGKIAAFLDLEGGFDLDGDIHVLRAIYRMGCGPCNSRRITGRTGSSIRAAT